MLWYTVVAVCCLLGLGRSTPVQTPEVIEHFTDSYAEERAGLFEGDINEDPEKRGAISKSHIWPGGRIPYHIESSKTSTERALYEKAMREIEDDTKSNGKYCIQFVPRTSEHDYLTIGSHSGCHSHVGKKGGAQIVSLSGGCNRQGIVMHEFLHAVGFWHEQSRADRESYISIHYGNVQHGREHNFNVHVSDTLGSKYDFHSVMHYNAYSFATDRSLPTITTKTPGISLIGQRFSLSTIDVEKVQLLYGCPVDTGHIFSASSVKPIIDCHFETDFCGMTIDNSGGADWVRYSGSTPTSGTGPKSDHTTGNGHYAYVEASGEHRRIARLKSHNSVPAGVYCLDVEIFLWGSRAGAGHLRIMAEENGRYYQLKSYSDHLRNGWYNLRLTVTLHNTFQLTLEADIGSTDLSDIAIDDLFFYPGHCR